MQITNDLLRIFSYKSIICNLFSLPSIFTSATVFIKPNGNETRNSIEKEITNERYEIIKYCGYLSHLFHPLDGDKYFMLFEMIKLSQLLG